MKIAILGAKTRIGVQLLDSLDINDFLKENIIVLDDGESVGEPASFGEDNYIIVKDFLTFIFSDSGVTHLVNLLGDKYLEQLKELFNKYGIEIINYNNSLANDVSTALIVDGVNTKFIAGSNTVIASPSSTSIVLSKILSVLSLNYKPLEVSVVANYSVSEQGNLGLEELFEQTKGIFTNQQIIDTKKNFTKQIAFNTIPHVGMFTSNGFTSEEENIGIQVNKILQQFIPITMFAMFVPVFIGNTLFVTLNFDEEVDLNVIKSTLQNNKDFTIVDYLVDEGYVTPAEVVGENKIYLTRFKYSGMQNNLSKNTISFMAVFDNLLVSATNIVNLLKF